jgi:oligopeptide/dipeptide ABC transporter ATP-binding protein
MVRYLSDRMAVMYLGSVVEIGKAADVYFQPRHPYTQILIASNPEPDPGREKQRLSTPIQGEIPSPVNVPAGCRFASRCPKVMPVCREKTPALLPLVNEERLVACHLYTEPVTTAAS